MVVEPIRGLEMWNLIASSCESRLFEAGPLGESRDVGTKYHGGLLAVCLL
jgi:hypothetical protein